MWWYLLIDYEHATIMLSLNCKMKVNEMLSAWPKVLFQLVLWWGACGAVRMRGRCCLVFNLDAEKTVVLVNIDFTSPVQSEPVFKIFTDCPQFYSSIGEVEADPWKTVADQRQVKAKSILGVFSTLNKQLLLLKGLNTLSIFCICPNEDIKDMR